MQNIVSEREREENSLSKFKLMLDVMGNLLAFLENWLLVILCR